MIVRLWTSTSPTTGLPFSTSTPSWHQLCDCGHLDNLPSDTRGPRGLLVDSDEPIPADVLELAAKASHVCKPESAPTRRARPLPANAHRWTLEEDAIIRANTCPAAAKLIGVSLSAVGRRRTALGIAVNKVRWTATEDAIITTRSRAEAAAELGVNLGVIDARRRHLRDIGKFAEVPRRAAA